MSVAKTETNGTQDRLGALMERRELKVRAKESEVIALKIERLELEEKLEAETGGELGKSFAIVDATHLGEGFIAFKLGPALVHTRLQKSKVTDGDVDLYLKSCLVHPSPEKLSEIFERRPALARGACLDALAKLYGVETEALAGKV